MKTTSLRFLGAFLALGVLAAVAPSVRADDPAEHAAEIERYQNELWQQTVQDQNDLRNLADEMAKSRQEIIDQARNQPDAQPAQPVAGSVVVPPKAPVAGPAAVPQVRFPAQAVPQQPPMPFDPIAFQQKVRQDQERVRQQIVQMQQQIMQRHDEIIQQHQLLTMGLHR